MKDWLLPVFCQGRNYTFIGVFSANDIPHRSSCWIYEPVPNNEILTMRINLTCFQLPSMPCSWKTTTLIFISSHSLKDDITTDFDLSTHKHFIDFTYF